MDDEEYDIDEYDIDDIGDEDFDYEQFVQDEFSSNLTNTDTSPLWRLVAVAILSLIALTAFLQIASLF